VRIVLAEKGIEYETVVVDLDDRPAWIYEKNPSGRVPVLEEDTLMLPESEVIMEYLDERYAERPLLPSETAARAEARLRVFRFDELLGDDYYAFRRGEPNRLAERLEELPVGESLFVDVAFAPWVIRARELLAVSLPAKLEAWLDELSGRPPIAAELELVRGLV
jgi:glutathione S-transferase